MLLNQQKEPIVVQITDGLSVHLTPHVKHVFLMSTAQVAEAYDVNESAIRRHKSNKEFIEGIHFVSVTNRNAQAQKFGQSSILYTKRGVIRLGFFIKSVQAQQVRQWAEDALFEKLESPKSHQMVLPLQPIDNRSNLAYPPQYDRELVELLVKIDSKLVRTKLFTKLKKGGLL